MTINGKEIKLYYPNGDSIDSLETFIDFYSKCYYINNNKEVEDVIDDILKNGIKSSVELFRVLAWKFGKINMKKSKSDDFKYYGDSNKDSLQLQIPYKKHFIKMKDIEEIYTIVKKYTGDCYTVENAKNFLKGIKKVTEPSEDTEKKTWRDYFYPVYIITLLYFVSNGKYPIVDSFSYVALDAICSNIDYGQRVEYPGLLGRDNDKFEEIISKGTYADYIDRLKIFKEIKEPRKVDQALWVYGKLFKK